MKNRIIFCIILFVLIPFASILTGTLLYDRSFASGAKGNLVISGSDNFGLRVDHSQNPFIFKNLYPGYPGCADKESSTIVKVSNIGNKNFTLLIEKKVMSADEEELILYDYEGLRMDVIEHGTPDNKLYSGPLKELKKIDAGTVSPGAGAREFEFSIYLDKNAGNELQGKSIDLQWIFTAMGATDDPDPPDSPDDPDHPDPPDPSDLPDPPGPADPVDSTDPPDSSGPSDLPGSSGSPDSPSGEEEKEKEKEEQIIASPDEPRLPPEEEIGDPKLPKTGEFPPVIYFGIGFFLVLAGLILEKYSLRGKL
ncbi:MAG TPA: hypothetical protein GX004_09055 [Firmicutes bacterium]|jgi:hypothetical protein|nr:hypothetical protein [Bacillota bacterium]